MPSFDDLVVALEGAVGKGAVAPIARYHDPNLRLRDDAMHVFIGDCHLLGAADAARYPNCHFTVAADLRRALQALLILACGSADGLRVYHTGDFLDLWRASAGPTVRDKVRKIQAAFEAQLESLWGQRPVGLGATILAGNHDLDTRDLSGWRAPRYLLLPAEDVDGFVFVTHGDVFDPVEKLPQWLKELAVRIAKGHNAGTVDLDAGRRAKFDEGLGPRAVKAKAPPCSLPGEAPVAGQGIPDKWNLTRPPGQHALFNAASTLAKELVHGQMNVRLAIIGHTHHARIAVREREGQPPFVLLDCGAWFGRCRLPGETDAVWSAQLGVVAGNDVRLYQVGRRTATV